MNFQLLNTILTALDNNNNSTIYNLLLQSLQSHKPLHSQHCTSLIMRSPDVLDILSEQSNGELEVCAARVAVATYHGEMQSLIQLNMGFHFHGTTACLSQLEKYIPKACYTRPQNGS
jgi:hypothetical protein